ncbi:MAG: hypothetical protein N2513_10450, partial [Deltaproteobacteria bacterium]|nr:hypothetical protein [Deltaproteobacteria bacterium]
MPIYNIKILDSIKNLKEKELYFGPLQGFETIEEAFISVERLGAKRSAAVIIRYKQRFYAVLMQSYWRQVIIGSDRTWFKDENGYFLVEKSSSFKMPYEIVTKVKKELSSGLIEDLVREDPDITAYTSSYGMISENKELIYGYNNNYAVLFGLTTKDTFYRVNEIWMLKRYFNGVSRNAQRNLMIEN